MTTSEINFLAVHIAGEPPTEPGGLAFTLNAEVALEPGETIISEQAIGRFLPARFDATAEAHRRIRSGQKMVALNLMLTNFRLIWHLAPVDQWRKPQRSALSEQFDWGGVAGSAIWAAKKAARKMTTKPKTVQSGQVRHEHISLITVTTEPATPDKSTWTSMKLMAFDSDQVQRGYYLTLEKTSEIGPFVTPIARAAAQRQLDMAASHASDPRFTDAWQRLVTNADEPSYGARPDGSLVVRLPGHYSIGGSEPRLIAAARAMEHS